MISRISTQDPLQRSVSQLTQRSRPGGHSQATPRQGTSHEGHKLGELPNMEKRGMSNKVQHTENTGGLVRPMGQIPAHHAEPGTDYVKSRVHSSRAIQQVKDHQGVCERHFAGPNRRALKEEADTYEVSTACSPAGKDIPRTTRNPRGSAHVVDNLAQFIDGCGRPVLMLRREL